jgi:hypothetical protein
VILLSADSALQPKRCPLCQRTPSRKRIFVYAFQAVGMRADQRLQRRVVLIANMNAG